MKGKTRKEGQGKERKTMINQGKVGKSKIQQEYLQVNRLHV